MATGPQGEFYKKLDIYALWRMSNVVISWIFLLIYVFQQNENVNFKLNYCTWLGLHQRCWKSWFFLKGWLLPPLGILFLSTTLNIIIVVSAFSIVFTFKLDTTSTSLNKTTLFGLQIACNWKGCAILTQRKFVSWGSKKLCTP